MFLEFLCAPFVSHQYIVQICAALFLTCVILAQTSLFKASPSLPQDFHYVTDSFQLGFVLINIHFNTTEEFILRIKQAE